MAESQYMIAKCLAVACTFISMVLVCTYGKETSQWEDNLYYSLNIRRVVLRIRLASVGNLGCSPDLKGEDDANAGEFVKACLTCFFGQNTILLLWNGSYSY